VPPPFARHLARIREEDTFSNVNWALVSTLGAGPDGTFVRSALSLLPLAA